MPFNIQGPELILILIIALIVIGPGKLPDVGSALGKSIREFRKAASDVKETTRLDAAPTTASAGQAAAVGQASPPVPPAAVPPVAAPTVPPAAVAPPSSEDATSASGAAPEPVAAAPASDPGTDRGA